MASIGDEIHAQIADPQAVLVAVVLETQGWDEQRYRFEIAKMRSKQQQNEAALRVLITHTDAALHRVHGSDDRRADVLAAQSDAYEAALDIITQP